MRNLPNVSVGPASLETRALHTEPSARERLAAYDFLQQRQARGKAWVTFQPLKRQPASCIQAKTPSIGQLGLKGSNGSLQHTVTAAAQPPASPGLLTGLFEAIRAGLEQQTSSQRLQPASLAVNKLSHQPPGKL